MSASETQGRVWYGTSEITYSVERGRRAGPRIVVTPQGLVQARVPERFDDAAVTELMQRRAGWVAKQLSHFERYRPRETPRTYQSGETIRYLGRQYRLKVVRGSGGADSVRLAGRQLVVELRGAAEPALIQRRVTAWLRGRANDVLLERLAACSEVTSRHGIRTPRVQMRTMTRRWGSCTGIGVVLLNPKLVQTPVDVIDYVIVHEVAHVKEPNHGPRFYRLLDVMMPDWRLRRLRLERLALPDW